MSEVFPIVYLARHGETAWTITGQHTGLTDLPLTERGERNARRLAERLRGLTFARVLTSPLQRATRTCLSEYEASGRSPFQPDKAILRYTDTITKCHSPLYDIQ
jgi:broad specificity phosphatase PhoE